MVDWEIATTATTTHWIEPGWKDFPFDVWRDWWDAVLEGRQQFAQRVFNSLWRRGHGLPPGRPPPQQSGHAARPECRHGTPGRVAAIGHSKTWH